MLFEHWNEMQLLQLRCVRVCVKCFCVHPWMFLCVHACFQAWRLCVCACVDACMHMCVWVFVHAWCMCLACVHVCVCLCVYVCVNMCMHVPSCSQICACSSQDCCVPGCDTWQPFRDDATSDNARSIREAAMDSARTEPWSQEQSNIKVKCSTWSEQWLIFFLKWYNLSEVQNHPSLKWPSCLPCNVQHNSRSLVCLILLVTKWLFSAEPNITLSFCF